MTKLCRRAAFPAYSKVPSFVSQGERRLTHHLRDCS
jgi:hypothetical protein